MSWALRIVTIAVSASPTPGPGAGLRNGAGIVVLALIVGGLLLLLSRLRKR